MIKGNKKRTGSDMLSKYDFNAGVRGKYVKRQQEGSNVAILDRDVAHACFTTGLSFSEKSFTVHLNDGREITIPLAWYPRLLAGTKNERENYELIGGGEGVHWPKLDEDIFIEGLLAGRTSQESQSSLKKWLQKRKK